MAKVAELGLEKGRKKDLLLQPSRAPTAEEKKLISSQERGPAIRGVKLEPTGATVSVAGGRSSRDELCFKINQIKQ